jgi:hypothetical protein
MLPDFTGRYVIMEAPSMLQARMNAAVRSIAAGAPFAEGHELSASPTSLTGYDFQDFRGV